ncbi:hypothetical protein LMG24238_00106 [Paraburkholderia sediminicola]|uniref:Uncharacterized protein n=1 Tax=Paraburkholderia sediminicola TaxID=458836 RepID=A0A6J4ZUT8_9BURK|nr:hypothetical protein LMG24238_00106 [Paraburkholderia sediminicola]
MRIYADWSYPRHDRVTALRKFDRPLRVGCCRSQTCAVQVRALCMRHACDHNLAFEACLSLSSQLLKNPETCDHAYGQQNKQNWKRREQHKSTAKIVAASHGMPWLEDAVVREQVKECAPGNQCYENPDTNRKRVQCTFLNRAYFSFVVLSHWQPRTSFQNTRIVARAERPERLLLNDTNVPSGSANYGVRFMGRPTKKMIRVALAICTICVVIGVYYFRWQGVDTSIANAPDYPSAGGIR